MQFKVPTLNILCTAGMQRRGHLGLEGDHRAVQWIRSLSPIILLCISKWVEILYEGDFVTKVIIYDQFSTFFESGVSGCKPIEKYWNLRNGLTHVFEGWS